jgi:hypothetical protein
VTPAVATDYRGTSHAQSSGVATLLLLFTLIALPALGGFLGARRELAPRRAFSRAKLQPGAPIIYRVVETSTHPVREGRDIRPAERGEFYYYVTQKYWRVEEVRPDGMILARSSFMEQHCLRADDPNLRKASLVERLRYGARFPFPA